MKFRHHLSAIADYVGAEIETSAIKYIDTTLTLCRVTAGKKNINENAKTPENRYRLQRLVIGCGVARERTRRAAANTAGSDGSLTVRARRLPQLLLLV